MSVSLSSLLLGVSYDHSNFIRRRRVCHTPLFTNINTVLSFWGSEVEILQQCDQEEEDLLTSQLFTKTRTFTYSVQCSLQFIRK